MCLQKIKDFMPINAIKRIGIFLLTISMYGSSSAMFNFPNMPHVVISDTHANIATAGLPTLIALGGCALLLQNGNIDDSKSLSILGATTLVAAGGTYALTKKLTLQAQINQCECELKNLGDNIIFKKKKDKIPLEEKLSKENSKDKVIKFFNKKIAGPDVFIGHIVLQHINDLDVRIKKQENKLRVIVQKRGGEFFENEKANDSDIVTRSFARVTDHIKPMQKQLEAYSTLTEKLRQVLRNSKSAKEGFKVGIKAKRVNVKEAKINSSNRWNMITTIFATSAISGAIASIMIHFYQEMFARIFGTQD